MQHVGKKIKALIDESKYSAKEIAEKMGTSFQNVYRLFEKESVETKHLFKIAEALGITISQFFEEESRNDLIEEINRLKGEVQSNSETIIQLQNQILILEKLVRSNETIIKKQEMINNLVRYFGAELINPVDPSDPNFEKLFEVAKMNKNASSGFEFFLNLSTKPELKKAYFDFLAKSGK